MPQKPLNVKAHFNYGVGLSKQDIPVKDPEGRIIGKVAGASYNNVEGTILDLEITDPDAARAMQTGVISSVSFGENELRMVQEPPAPEPKVVHIVKSDKNHVTLCRGEPYSGSTGRGPVKLCTECYNKTFRDADVEDYL